MIIAFCRRYNNNSNSQENWNDNAPRGEEPFYSYSQETPTVLDDIPRVVTQNLFAPARSSSPPDLISNAVLNGISSMSVHRPASPTCNNNISRVTKVKKQVNRGKIIRNTKIEMASINAKSTCLFRRTDGT